MALELNGREHYGQLNFVDNTIESLTGDIDIQIGLTGSAADIKLNRNVVLAPGKTFGLVDTVTLDVAELSVSDGVLNIDGANQLQVGQLKFIDNTIESISPDIDIQIGQTGSSADLRVNRDVVLAPGKSFTLQGNTYQTGSIDVSGSVTATGGFLGNATTSTTASFALTSSYLQNPVVSGSIGPITTMQFITGSDYILNAGQIAWDQSDGTFDMGLLNGVTLQVGQELHFYGKASGTIANGDAVMFAGSQGNHVLMSKATQAVINEHPEYFIGVATQAFTNNEYGYVTVLGKVNNLNTTAFSTGAVLYFDSQGSTAGALTATEPIAPYAKIEVAAVIRSHASQGTLMVRPHIMPFLADIQDIGITNATTGDLLVRADNTWTNSKQLTGSYAITGSLTSTQGFTGSLQGNATTSTSASYALNSTNAINADTVDGRHASEFVLNTATGSLATQTYVNTAVANLVDAAPGTLDTLNELAAALGDDPNFATTIATSVGTKQNQLNGTGFVKASGTTISYDNSTYYLASNPSGFITSGGSITGNAATATSATNATQLNGYSNQTEATILTGPANGPVWKVRYDGATANRYVDLGFKDGNGTYSEGLKIYNGDNFTWKGSTVLHAGNYSSYAVPTTRTITINGTALDLSADRSFTVTASDTTKLPLAGGTLTGTLGLVGYGTNGFTNGTGDGSSFTTYNFALSGWSSMAFYNPTGGGTFPNQVSGLIDFREGRINMKGDLRASTFYDSNDTGYYLNPAGNSNLYYASFANDVQMNGNYLKFDQSGTRSWSIRAAGGNLNFTSGDGSGTYTFTGATSFSSNSSWFGGYGSGSGPGLAFENQSTFARIVFWGLDFYDWNHGTQMVIDNGYVSANNSFRAPIFYDSNNTGYYVDPASSTTSMYMNGGMVTTAPGGTVLMKHAVSEVDAWLFQENAANWGLYWKNNPTGAHNFGQYTSIGAEFIGMSGANASGNGVLTSNYVGATSAYAQWMLSNYTGYMWSASTIYAGGDMRAPVFYDANDTTYYFDGTGGTRQSRYLTISGGGSGNNGNELVVGNTTVQYSLQDTNLRPIIQATGAYPVLTLNHTVTSNGSHGATVQFTSNGVGNQFVIGSSGNGSRLDIGTSSNTSWNPHNGIDNYQGTTGWRMDTSGNVYNLVSNRSPIYYDNNNTGYYVDPASTSNVLNIGLNGYINFNGSGTSVRISESYGILMNCVSTPWNVQMINTSLLVGLSASGGNYGIGNGYFTGDVTAYYSDRRLKHNLVLIDNAVEKVKSLNGYTYQHNQLGQELLNENAYKSHAGLVAQEVQAVLPEVVTIAPFDLDGLDDQGNGISKSGENYLTIKYERVVPLLIEAIKEQQTQIENQQSQIDELKSLVKQLLG